MPSPRDVVRNARLLLQSAAQHVADDPALLVVQVSRRLPFRVRVGAGRTLRSIAGVLPSTHGIAALGAYMAGDLTDAGRLIEGTPGSRSRMRGEVAVLLDRFDLLSELSAPTTQARAAWTRGDLSGALQILERDGAGGSWYARRLRSELRLLEPGYRLRSRNANTPQGASRAEGEAFRVLHVLTNSLPHTQSGYSLRSHRLLIALRRHGIESVALTRTGYPVMIGQPLAAKEDVVDGIRYARTLPSKLPRTQEDRLLAEVDRALELVAEFRPHVIHATTNYHNALVAQAVAARARLPWILEVRGLMEKTWIASHRSPEARAHAARSEKVRLVREREGELARAASAVITLGSTMAAQLVERDVPEERITLVPNGVDAQLLEGHVSAEEARRKVGLGLPDGAFAVGAVSALVDYEGFDVLLRAAAQLINDPDQPVALHERLHVVLAGDGASAPGLAELARELGIQDRVHMPGRVRAAQARRWVESLDVVVVPRLDREVSRIVTPQKPIEALALGRPVVLSDLPALRETVTAKDGTVHGVLVTAGSATELADAISLLARADAQGEKLADEGPIVARERTWSELTNMCEGVYREVAT